MSLARAYLIFLCSEKHKHPPATRRWEGQMSLSSFFFYPSLSLSVFSPSRVWADCLTFQPVTMKAQKIHLPSSIRLGHQLLFIKQFIYPSVEVQWFGKRVLMRDDFGTDIASVGDPGSRVGIVCVHICMHYNYNTYEIIFMFYILHSAVSFTNDRENLL